MRNADKVLWDADGSVDPDGRTAQISKKSADRDTSIAALARSTETAANRFMQ
jgi:hypothetical protein